MKTCCFLFLLLLSLRIAPASFAQDTGTGILYYAARTDGSGLFDPAASGFYWTPPDGSARAPILSYDTITGLAPDLLQIVSPSPDGRRLLYLAQTLDGFEAVDIFSLDVETSVSTQLTVTSGSESSWNPVWSPDST